MKIIIERRGRLITIRGTSGCSSDIRHTYSYTHTPAACIIMMMSLRDKLWGFSLKRLYYQKCSIQRKFLPNTDYMLFIINIILNPNQISVSITNHSVKHHHLCLNLRLAVCQSCVHNLLMISLSVGMWAAQWVQTPASDWSKAVWVLITRGLPTENQTSLLASKDLNRRSSHARLTLTMPQINTVKNKPVDAFTPDHGLWGWQ